MSPRIFLSQVTLLSWVGSYLKTSGHIYRTMDHIFRALRYLMKWGSWSGAGVKQGNLFGENFIIISFGSCLVKVLKCWSLGKYILLWFSCSLSTMDSESDTQESPILNSISFHFMTLTGLLAVYESGHNIDWGMFRRPRLHVAHPFLSRVCMINHDQPRSTTINMGDLAA